LGGVDLSVAGRYDRYDDFGGTFNPQYGVVWKPLAGLAIRGAYSESFRAASLGDYGAAFPTLVISNQSDPTTGGTTPVLTQSGVHPDLGPEKAKTWSAGFDYTPSFASWLRTSFSYFDIAYTDRLDTPVQGADTALVLQRANRFPGLITRNPSAAQVAQLLATDLRGGSIANNTGRPFNPATQNILTVFPNLVLLDNRFSNVAVEKVRGLDFSATATVDTEIGQMSLGVNGTYTLQHDRQVTASSPAFALLNEIGKPADLRLRTTVGWNRGAWGGYVYGNYTTGYADPFTTPAGRVESWTTADLTVRFDGTQLADAGLLRGVQVAFSVDNLFDTAPPGVFSNTTGLRYDPTNASPIGRFVSLRVTKRW
jgi:outer membrane receptor protein involved in Fe transport